MCRSCLLICLTAFLVPTDRSFAADEATGYLKIEPKTDKAKTEIIRYAPREGDLVFYDDHSLMWTLLFAYAGTGSPLHMGIVVKKTDGSFAVLEAGPDDTVRVALLDLDKRLPQFDKDFAGNITIRRCKKELTKDQSAALTKFAHAQDGKRYAIGRLLLQGTWLRSRGPLRELVLGRTDLDRDSWICSELCVAASVVAKLLDGKTIYANSTYRRDLIDNERHDLSAGWHDAAAWLALRPKDGAEKK